jgi:hypothetical protein
VVRGSWSVVGTNHEPRTTNVFSALSYLLSSEPQSRPPSTWR